MNNNKDFFSNKMVTPRNKIKRNIENKEKFRYFTRRIKRLPTSIIKVFLVFHIFVTKFTEKTC